MARLSLGRRAIVSGAACVLGVSLLGGSTAPAVPAAGVNRWAIESQQPTGDTHGWFTSDTEYPISVGLIDPTIPGYDPDTILVYGGSVHLGLIGPNGAPIQAGSYAGVTGLLDPQPGHAAMD